MEAQSYLPPLHFADRLQKCLNHNAFTAIPEAGVKPNDVNAAGDQEPQVRRQDYFYSSLTKSSPING
jgi:hypothetical protein